MSTASALPPASEFTISQRDPPPPSPPAVGLRVQSREDATVAEHLPLVRFIAVRVAATIPVRIDLDDLIQTGTIGLLDAVRRYDPSKGIPFPAYARFRIRGAILDSLRQLDWATRNQRKQRKAAASADSADGGTQAGPAQFFMLGPVISLSTRNESQDELPAPDVACGEGLHPDRLYEVAEARDLIGRAMHTLPSRYREVVKLYYYSEQSMREIGRTLGVNESRISQIHKAALIKMRRALASEGAPVAANVA